jgi:hypothetical protein
MPASRAFFRYAAGYDATVAERGAINPSARNRAYCDAWMPTWRLSAADKDDAEDAAQAWRISCDLLHRGVDRGRPSRAPARSMTGR